MEIALHTEIVDYTSKYGVVASLSDRGRKGVCLTSDRRKFLLLDGKNVTLPWRRVRKSHQTLLELKAP